MPDGDRHGDHDHCLGGRAGQTFARRVHLFGDTGSGNIALANFYEDFDQAFDISEPQITQGTERLWLVSSAGREVQRTSDPGASALTLPEVLNPNSLPAGASGVDRTQMKIRLLVTDATGTRPIEFDVGGSIELHALGLGAEVLAPDNFVEVVPESGQGGTANAPAARIGNLVDALVGLKIVPIENSVGHNSILLTRNIRVPLNTQGTLEVPRGAVAVTIYQHPNGAASVQWTGFYGDPALVATTTVAGMIPFLAGLRRTEPETILPNMTHLRSDLDVANDRFYTAVFTIQP